MSINTLFFIYSINVEIKKKKKLTVIFLASLWSNIAGKDKMKLQIARG